MNSAESVSKFLITLLNLAILFLVLTAFAVSTQSFLDHSTAGLDLIISTIFTFAFYGVFIFMIFKLKSILLTVKTGDPFCPNNIKSFYTIAISIFVLGAFDLIGNLNSHQGIILIGTPNFVIKATSFIYILLGCLALVLAEVFKMAYKIKGENDLTI